MTSKSRAQWATAFAPATVANVAVGFDLLGFAVDCAGDTVTVAKTREPTVEIKSIDGLHGLPLDPSLNTATVGLLALLKDQNPRFGFEVSIKKGIPLGSGMGGSAASAVGAIVAANALLQSPLSHAELMRYALMGESVASGSAHADNIAPCLYGGITLALMDPIEVLEVPIPTQIFCSLVHPHLRLNTRESRRVLKSEVSLKNHVLQSGHLGAFIYACFKNQPELFKRTLVDVIIEPARAQLIPAFKEVQAAALGSGALGCSISGSGPSVFAWSSSRAQAEVVSSQMRDAFLQGGVKTVDAWVTPIARLGARLIAQE